MRAQGCDVGVGHGGQQFAGACHGLLAPRPGHGVHVHVGLAGRQQAGGAEFGQPRVDAPADAAEVRIAGVAQSKHRILQIRQPGRAAAGEEFGKADRVVRRVAFALGADHDVQQALGGQFAGRVGIGADQPYRQPVGLGLPGQVFGGTFGVAGLTAVQHGKTLAGKGLGGGGRCGHGCGGMPPRQSGGMAGQPPQPGGIQPVDEPRKPGQAVFAQGRWR